MRTLHASVNAQFGAAFVVGPLSAPDLLGENPDWVLDGLAQPAVLSSLVRDHLSALEDHSTAQSSGSVLAVGQGLTNLVDGLASGATLGSQESTGQLSQGGYSPSGEGGVAVSGSGYSLAGFPDSGTGEPATTEQDGAGSGEPSGPLSLLVKFAPGAAAADMAMAAAAVGGALGEVVRGEGSPFHTGGAVHKMTLGGGLDPERAIEILSRLPGVEYAEQNWTVSVEALSVEATSSDPYYTGGNLWGMHGDDPSHSTKNPYGSQAADAWLADQTGSMSTVVGVIDTGIDPTHIDLYRNIWINQEEIPTALRSNLVDTDLDGLITFRDLDARDATGAYVNAAFVSDKNGNNRIDALDLLADSRWADGIDTDKNGFTDDFYGWDFRNEDNNPFDDHNHGTHVAGTIGALSNNQTGVVGVAWNVQIMALKFLSSSGSGAISDAVEATDYFTLQSAASPGQHFVATNNSWGGGGFSQSMLDAITAGARADILFVASAGNGKFPRGGTNNDTSEHYPSNYNTSAGAGYDAVIAVASIDSDGGLSSFSNYGATTVDLGAPGGGIWSTVPGNSYASYSGTSMASPHVTGGLAVAAAFSPGTSAQELREALLNSTTYTKELDGKTVTGGRLAVDTFLDGTAPSVAITAITTDTGVSGSDFVTSDRSLSFLGTAEAGALVTLTLGGDTLGNVTADGSGQWQFAHQTDLVDGTHTLTASTSNALDTQDVTVDNQGPTVSITVALADPADTVLSIGETASLTFAFSEAVSGFDANDVVLSGAGGGTLGTLSSADDGATWTGSFTPAADLEIDPATISVALDSYADIAGNLGAGNTSDGFVIDTRAPAVPTVVAQSTTNTMPTVTGNATLAVGETLLVNVAGTDYTETSGLTISGSDWSLTVGTALNEGTTYDVTATVTDAAGNQTEDATSGELVIEGTITSDSFIFGTDGSDTLLGRSSFSETISGLPDPTKTTSTALGEGTIDVLTGGTGDADTFIFGDSRGAFYDDGNSKAGNNGKSDYGQIDDFNSGDQIQLFGAASDYLLAPWTQNGVSGTGIFRDSNGDLAFDSRDELIGLVQVAEGPALSLDSNSTQFSFVSSDDVLV